jgi:crossover junction endodeoxyribonuclease RuvC
LKLLDALDDNDDVQRGCAAKRKVSGAPAGAWIDRWSTATASAMSPTVWSPTPRLPLAERLAQLAEGLEGVLALRAGRGGGRGDLRQPQPVSTLKLGQARGIALLAPARPAFRSPNTCRTWSRRRWSAPAMRPSSRSQMMVRMLLPGAGCDADAADALAVAICHAHHRQTAARLAAAMR